MSNIQFRCPGCNQPIEQPFDMLGQLIDCPSCGEVVEVQKSHKLPLPPIHAPRAVPKLKMPKPPPNSRKTLQIKEYKVLSQRDEWFAEAFSPEKLEQALNAYATKGWQVISIVTTCVPAGSDGTRGEFMVILGRNKI